MPIAHLAPTSRPRRWPPWSAGTGPWWSRAWSAPACSTGSRPSCGPFSRPRRPGPTTSAGTTRRTGALIARSPASRELVMHPLALGTAADVPRARHQLPAAPHPGHRHRPRRDGPADPPRPVGLRLLPLPAGLRGAVQHHLGPHRLHRGERRHPDRAGQQPPRTSVLRARRHRAGRDDAGLGALLLGQRVPRRRGQPFRARPDRPQHHLQRGLVAPGGEPVPLGAAEVAATLPVDLLRLMGYDRGAYALGYIDDLRDPIEAVRPGLGSTGFAVSLDGRKESIAAGRAPTTVESCPSRSDWPRRDDYDELYDAFSRIVDAGDGFPRRDRDAGRVRRLLDRPFSAVCVAKFGGYLIGALLHQAELRRPGRPHRQRRLLRARAVPGDGGRPGAGGALPARGPAAGASTPCNSTWSSSRTRPGPCRPARVRRDRAGYPRRSRARMH